MGARGKGHIAWLCSLAAPTVGVVTSVGAAHTELFGTVEAVAEAKGELVESLDASGRGLLNADQPLVAAMAERTEAAVLTFGRAMGEIRASGVSLDDGLCPRFRLETPNGQSEVALAVCGEHMVDNALAAAAAALALGVGVDEIAAGLGSVQLSPWRMEVTTLASGAVLINDAYNANPMSMTAGLRSLAAVDRPRRVAVLGIMAELGDRAAAEHAAIGALARELGIEVIPVATPDYGPPRYTMPPPRWPRLARSTPTPLCWSKPAGPLDWKRWPRSWQGAERYHGSQLSRVDVLSGLGRRRRRRWTFVSGRCRNGPRRCGAGRSRLGRWSRPL